MQTDSDLQFSHGLQLKDIQILSLKHKDPSHFKSLGEG